MELAGHEGWLLSLGLILLPFIILSVFIKYFLPVEPKDSGERPIGANPPAKPITAS